MLGYKKCSDLKHDSIIWTKQWQYAKQCKLAGTELFGSICSAVTFQLFPPQTFHLFQLYLHLNVLKNRAQNNVHLLQQKVNTKSQRFHSCSYKNQILDKTFPEWLWNSELEKFSYMCICTSLHWQHLDYATKPNTWQKWDTTALQTSCQRQAQCE